jgi:invasion protein IalB
MGPGKGINGTMAYSRFAFHRVHLRGLARARRPLGAATLISAIGVGLLAGPGTATAQQPKTPPAAKAPPAAQPGAAANPPQSAWVKLCEKATSMKREKDGKEEKKDVNICLTHHERLDGNTGMVLVSAAVRQVEGQDKQAFMVMVPLGMLLQPGMRAAVYPKDAWEKAQNHEKIDETKLKTITLAYTLCHPAGCTAETEATPELLSELKTGAGLVVLAINVNGQAVGFPVPLNGFEQSYNGAPVDTKQYSEARRALMQQIAAHQQELIEAQKKKMEEEQKKAKGAPPTTPPAKK